MTSSLLEFEWDLPQGVRAAFTTRQGGYSAAPWDSFNVATHVGDDHANVAGKQTPSLNEMRSLLLSLEA